MFPIPRPKFLPFLLSPKPATSLHNGNSKNGRTLDRSIDIHNKESHSFLNMILITVNTIQQLSNISSLGMTQYIIVLFVRMAIYLWWHIDWSV